jgi:hypothetical protein
LEEGHKSDGVSDAEQSEQINVGLGEDVTKITRQLQHVINGFVHKIEYFNQYGDVIRIDLFNNEGEGEEKMLKRVEYYARGCPEFCVNGVWVSV